MNQMKLFEVAFCQYHEKNPQIYNKYEELTLQLIEKGVKHYGTMDMIGAIRWTTAVSGSGKYKVNNNYAPYYARLFESRHPEHKGFFRKRKSRYDEE
jgi:hypothetical protein